MRPSKFTIDQIIQIIAETNLPNVSISEVCRKYGIAYSTIDKWRKKYQGLSSNEAKRLKALEIENSSLKRIIAEQALEINLLRDIVKKIRYEIRN